MSEYPLRGNGIEIHENEGDSERDKRKYNVVVEDGLHKIMTKEGAKWQKETFGRERLDYEAAKGEEDTEYPLRGEGIEVRHNEGSSNPEWESYSIYVAPDLKTVIIDDAQRLPEESSDDEESKRHTKKHTDWARRDGDKKPIVAYFAHDEIFTAAAGDLPCTKSGG